MVMGFDVEGARKAGYSDEEIAEHLATRSKFDLDGAKSAGYSPGEVIAHLVGKAPIKQEPGVAEKVGKAVVGAGETALTALTGATGGTVGMLLGGANQMGADVAGLVREGASYKPTQSVEEAATKGASMFTYAPRTDAGQEMAEGLGAAAQNLIPVAGLGPQMTAISNATRPATQAAGMAARSAADAAKKAAVPIVEAAVNAKNAVSTALRAEGGAPAPAATPGTMGSVGAAGTDMATQRQMAAAALPEPIALTKGQATRDFAQQQFEREAAKSPTPAGAKIRERFAQQNAQVQGSIDSWLDAAGGTAPDLRSAGVSVDKALRSKFEARKGRVRAAYAAARASDEARALVDVDAPVTVGAGDSAITSSPIQYINEQPTGLKTTSLTDYARQSAVKLGIAENVDGKLVARPATVGTLEKWRSEIGQAAGYEPNDVRNATILKKMIDGQTEPVAGPLFKAARKERENLAREFEDKAVIDRLLSTKRGTTDRSVAFEDVFDHAILKGSLDDTKAVGRTLKSAGPEGQQAWADLRGQTLQYIKDQATKNVARDERGNAIVSAAGLDKAIRSLDADGKLDYVFGKRGAAQLRDLNDLTKDIYTAPPGSVNTSNTASALTAMMDLVISSTSGVPVPVATTTRLLTAKLKDRKLAARINDALGEKK